MSDFIVSARKYRPATFASVVGQKHITSTLQNAIERAQLAHAYLFCGPRGVGKTTCARIFAKAINCLAPNGSEACNACESCRSFNEGRSLNIHELDAASNNSVDDIRTLIEQVRIIPQVGRYSLFIIDEVHMLSAAAFNAFLKTLEEPPAHALFILATTEKHKIIPTILSRCQIYDFNRIRVEDSVEYLKYIATEEHITADEESLNLIAQKADGGMRDALSMFDKAVSFCGTSLDYRNVAQTLNVLDYDTYFGVTEMLLTGNYVEVLVAFDEVLAKGFSGQTFMSGLNHHMRDLLMAKSPETLRLIEMTGTLLERYRTQAGACTTEFLFGAITVLTELDGKIRQSSSQRLLVELGLMKISGLGQKKNNPLTSSEEYPLPELTPRTVIEAPQTPSVAVDSAQTRVKVVSEDTQIAAEHAAMTTVRQTTAEVAGRVIEAAETAEVADKATEVAEVADKAIEAAEATEVAEVTDKAIEVAEATEAAEVTDKAIEVAEVMTKSPTMVTEETTAPHQPAPTPPAPVQPNSSKPRTAKRSLISGASLSELLAEVNEVDIEGDDAEAIGEGEELSIDADCSDKLEYAREQILSLIKEKRPRFVPAFELMIFRDNIISVSVPTEELREEMLRNKTAMLMRIAELAAITGAIELEVIVDEQIRAARPIKLEDRVKYITEKNPLVLELRKALDLDVE